MPDGPAAPAGVSSRPRSRKVTTIAIATATRNTGDSRNENAVWSKSTPRFAPANAPAASVGRNGRRPAAQASPVPCRMSRTSFMDGAEEGGWWDSVRWGADDCRRQARAARARRPSRAPSPLYPGSRALRGPVRVAHEGHEVLGDARSHGDHRAPRDHLARRRAPRHVDVPGRVARRADVED